MAVVSTTPAELEAYNKLPPSEQLNNEVKLFENRVRLLPTAGVPLLKELETFFGKEVIIMDKLTSKTEQRATTAKSMSTSVISSASSASGYVGAPLKFEFFNITKFMNDPDLSAKSRFRLFTAIDYLSVNPLSVQEAMRLRYNFSWQPENVAFFTAYPTVLFSDAKDQQQTAFVSIAQDKHNIITSHCRFFGAFDDVVEKKLVGLSHRFDSLHAFSKATAVYRFLTASIQDRRYAGSIPSEMTMTFSWSSETSPTTFLSSPAATSKVVVHCCPGWKDPRVSLFEETCILENLLCMAQTLRDGIPMVWPKNDDQSETVIPRVQTLIEQCSLSKQEAKGSRFYDFTEQLFDILRLATNNETLVEALRIVFIALRSAKINTILHADNKTTLARLIRDSLAGDLNLPRLEAMTPIQILLEIGIERFRRNMINTFVQEKLVVSPEEFKLQYMDQGGSAEENALRLLPLHLALLTIMELTKYLTMSEHGLSTLRRRVLSDYTARPIETVTNMFTFEASVLFSEINPKMLKCVKPSMWLNEVVYSAKASSHPVARTFTHFTKQLSISYLEDIVNEAAAALDTSMETDSTEIRYACSLLTASYNKKSLEVLQ